MKRWLLVALTVLIIGALAFAVPPALRMANTSALAALARGDGEGAARTFGILAFLGQADAINNLAVIRLRGLDGARDREAGIALLERAVAKGHLVAGYNLARLAENRYSTPIEEVARTIALLEPLVAVGDPHAASELADALTYHNRDAVVPDRAARQIALRRAAAETGDRVYVYRLARDLWDAGRSADEPELSLEAILLMQRAAEGGERRAMLHMGDMEWQLPSSVEAFLPDGFPGGDRYDWWARGAAAGSIAATCRHATNYFRAQSHLEALPPVHDGPRPDLDARTQTALAHLRTCADVERVRGPRNPFFGVPALYVSRPMGGYERVVTSRSYAKMILGTLLLEGRLVERDSAAGRAYLEAAAEENDYAAALLATLPR